jgi:hypothetical protein
MKNVKIILFSFILLLTTSCINDKYRNSLQSYKVEMTFYYDSHSKKVNYIFKKEEYKSLKVIHPVGVLGSKSWSYITYFKVYNDWSGSTTDLSNTEGVIDFKINKIIKVD